MTSLLREDTPVPMPEAASATTPSWPAIAAARAIASPTTPAPTSNTCIQPAPRRASRSYRPTPRRGSRSYLDRKPGVILRQRAHSRLRARHIIELGELALAIKRIVARIEMKQLRHPPGEALRLPDPPQARRRVALEQIG